MVYQMIRRSGKNDLRVLYGSLVKRLRHRPLTPVTGVRFPHESLFPCRVCRNRTREGLLLQAAVKSRYIVGVDDVEGPPVPMPNTEVKLNGAEDTWMVTSRKNRKMPTLKKPSNRAVFLFARNYG